MAPDVSSKKSSYVTLIFILLGIAFIVTSFDNPLNFFQPTVVSLGGHHIKRREFRNLLAWEYAQGSSPTFPALLSKLINNELVDLEAQQMGIQVSQQAARASFQKKPLFLDETGHFQEKKFQAFLTGSGLSLNQMLEQEKKYLRRKRLKEALMTQVTPPTLLVRLTERGAFQERVGAYKEFSLKKVGHSSSDKELKDLFEAHPIKDPEYRTYSILDLSIARGLPKSQFEQLMVHIEDDLGAGRSLEDIITRHKLQAYTKKVTTDAQGRNPLGLQLDPKDNQSVLTQAFSLSSEEGPKPIHLPPSRFVVIQVERTIPPKTLSFEEAKPRLEKVWQEKKQQEQMFEEAKAFANSPIVPHMKLTPSLSLNQSEPSVPPIVKEALFQLEPGQSLAVKDDHKAYAVKLLSVKPSAKSSPLNELVKDTLEHIFWDAYVTSLGQKYPIQINRQEIQKYFQKTP